MNRRQFTLAAGCAGLGALSPQGHAERLLASPADMGNHQDVVLEDADLLVAFDSVSGAITRLERKKTGWKLQLRPEFAANFRIFAPAPGRRSHFLEGGKQTGAKVEKISANEVRVHWPGMVSALVGKLPISFTAHAVLKDGELTFRAEIENKSTLTVESVEYPVLGDLHSPSPAMPLHAMSSWYDNLQSDEIYPKFDNEQGYWGVRFPRKALDTHKSNLFCLLQTQGQGMYVGLHDAKLPYMLQWVFEQHPGVMDSADSTVPASASISGMPVYLRFSGMHFIFAKPGATKTLAPYVMAGYDGDWQGGTDIYKRWRKSWFTAPHLPEWAKDVHSWLQLQINGSEEDYTISYKELPKYIDECAAAGVKAIQLVGWANGGQDRGDPIEDTDPHLGTWQDLRDAIAYAKSRDVKMILFGKLNYADVTTDAYRNELYKFAMKDPYGVNYEQNGYSYTTPVQLAGLNNRRRAVMDMLDPGYQAVCEREVKKILALDADGWLWDEICGYAATYNFAEGHGYEAPGYVYRGGQIVSKQLREMCDEKNRDFLFAGEAPQDWLRPWCAFSYARIRPPHRPVNRYIDSSLPMAMAVTGIDGREILNRILMCGYVISYEAYNFKGHVNDFPLTLAYGQKIDALRRRYQAFLWDGEFRDNVGAQVRATGRHLFGVFVTAAGKRAVVVVNDDGGRAIQVNVDLPNAGTLLWASPEQPEARAVSGAIEVPARSAVVVMES